MDYELYQRLRFAMLSPGESIGGQRKPYVPVNKDNWTWEDAMASEDTPDIAARRGKRETSFLFLLGRHGVGAVA